MNKRVKELWINALVSGEYSQAYGQLRTEWGYCCWGVLCNLHAKETGNEWNGNTYLGATKFIPEEVEKWAGLEKIGEGVIRGYQVTYEGNQLYLDVLNDTAVDFSTIAEVIKEQYPTEEES